MITRQQDDGGEAHTCGDAFKNSAMCMGEKLIAHKAGLVAAGKLPDKPMDELMGEIHTKVAACLET